MRGESSLGLKLFIIRIALALCLLFDTRTHAHIYAMNCKEDQHSKNLTSILLVALQTGWADLQLLMTTSGQPKFRSATMLESATPIAMILLAGLLYCLMFSSEHAQRLQEAHRSTIQNQIPISREKLEEGMP